MTERHTTADSSPGADAVTIPRRATVFLSYARADKDRAVRLVEALQADAQRESLPVRLIARDMFAALPELRRDCERRARSNSPRPWSLAALLHAEAPRR